MQQATTAALVVSPLNVVAAICAAKTQHPSTPPRIHVVVQSWPGLPAEVGREITDIVARMASPFDFVTAVHLVDAGTGGDTDAATTRNALRALLGSEAISEIYFPHDVGLTVLDGLYALWPQAMRICTGDALGFLVDRELHLGLLAPKEHALGAAMRRFRSLIAGARRTRAEPQGPCAPQDMAVKRRKVADCAIAILPVDQSGRFLREVPLLVPPKMLVRRVLAECHLACSELRQHEHDLIAFGGTRPMALMITENHAEGGFIDFDREIAMYCWAVREKCLPGTVVFIKPHPGESLPRAAEIAKKLSEFTVVPVDARFARYPIELFPDLVARCRVICMSYPSLSLRYLYGTDVRQPMNAAVIQRWFPRRVRASFRNAIETYDMPAQKLESWDGRSVLWSGSTRI